MRLPVEVTGHHRPSLFLRVIHLGFLRCLVYFNIMLLMKKGLLFSLRCLLRVLLLICIHVFDSCNVVSTWCHEVEMLISIFVLTMQPYRDSLFRPHWCYFQNSDYWFEAILLRCSCMNDLPWYWTLRHSIVTCVVASSMWHRFGSCNVMYAFF